MYYFYDYIILIFLFIVHIKTAKTSTTLGDDNDNDVSYIKRQEAMQLFLKGRREYSQYRNYDKAKLYFIQSLELNSKNSDAHYKHLISTLYDDSRIIIFLNEMKSTRIGNYTGLVSDNKKDKILIEIKNSIVKILET